MAISVTKVNRLFQEKFDGMVLELMKANDEKLHLGMFNTEIEAHEAYVEFSKKDGH